MVTKDVIPRTGSATWGEVPEDMCCVTGEVKRIFMTLESGSQITIRLLDHLSGFVSHNHFLCTADSLAALESLADQLAVPVPATAEISEEPKKFTGWRRPRKSDNFWSKH